MATRRILVIDDNPSFSKELNTLFGPYGFVVQRADAQDQSLSLCQEPGTELVIIAVDLPEKLGFALCHKAKKQFSIPVVLKTTTIPPEGFDKHKKLKSHASAYLDSRACTPEALVAAIGGLIPLGAPNQGNAGTPAQALQLDDIIVAADEVAADEVAADECVPAAEEVDISDLDSDLEHESNRVAEEQASPFSGVPEASDELYNAEESTNIVPPGFLQDADFELPDELPSALQTASDSEYFADTTNLQPTQAPEFHAPVAVLEGLEKKEPCTSDTEIAEEECLDDFEIEGITMAGVEILEELPLAPELKSQIAPEPEPEPEPECEPEFELAPEPELTPKPIAPSEQDPDSLPASECETSAKEQQTDIAMGALDEIATLRAENARLTQEANKPSSKSQTFSKEHEFLELRDKLNKKEKALLDSQDQLTIKDRRILDLTDELRALNRSRTELDEKSLSLEHELLAQREEIAELRSDLATAAEEHSQALGAKHSELESTKTLLELSETAHTEAIDAHADEVTRIQQAHAEALENLESAADRSRKEAKERHTAQIETLKTSNQEEQRVHEVALLAAKTEHESAMHEAKERLENATTELHARHEEALAKANEERERAEIQATDAHRHALAEVEATAQAVLSTSQQKAAEELESALSNSQKTLSERDEQLLGLRASIASKEQDIAARDARIASLKSQQEEIEEQNDDYEEQVLIACKKIETNEATVEKAKKALADVLALLNETSSDSQGTASDETAEP